MRGVHYSACSLCYKKIAQVHQKCSLMRGCSLFRRLLLPEYTVFKGQKEVISHFEALSSSQFELCAFVFYRSFKTVKREPPNLQSKQKIFLKRV